MGKSLVSCFFLDTVYMGPNLALKIIVKSATYTGSKNAV